MGKALALVLGRLPSARKVSDGYRARCPVHGGSALSLKVRENARGVALHCFAGCLVLDIARSLGLLVQDLFNDDGEATTRYAMREKRSASPAEVGWAVREHIRVMLAEEAEALGYVPPPETRRDNEAKRAAAGILGVVIPQGRYKRHEIGLPHSSDPLWAVFEERALQEVVWERRGFDFPVEKAPLRDVCDAQERAAGWIRSLARCSCGECSQCRGWAHAEKLRLPGCGTVRCGQGA
jgi:hypothetical protein